MYVCWVVPLVCSSASTCTMSRVLNAEDRQGAGGILLAYALRGPAVDAPATYQHSGCIY
jgi:hypothetical protein